MLDLSPERGHSSKLVRIDVVRSGCGTTEDYCSGYSTSETGDYQYSLCNSSPLVAVLLLGMGMHSWKPLVSSYRRLTFCNVSVHRECVFLVYRFTNRDGRRRAEVKAIKRD